MTYQPPNPNGSEDKAKLVQDEIDNVTGKVKDSIDQALMRGERIEVLDEKSDVIAQQSSAFNSRAKEVERAYCRQLWRTRILILLGIIIVILILYFSFKSDD